MSYSAEERETTLTVTDESRVWEVFSLMPTFITKMKKAGVEPYKVTEDGCHFYRIDYEQVSIRKKSEGGRQMSEEQRLAAAERLRKARENKNKSE